MEQSIFNSHKLYKTDDRNIPMVEQLSQEEIREYQQQRLSEMLQYIKKCSPFYQEIFRNNKIDIREILSLDDLQKVPFTTKDDLQKQNNGFLCVAKNRIIDYVTTSGTSGDPVTYALTESDLERLAYNEFISFACADGNADDCYQLITTIDRRFMAGLAYFLGIRKLCAGIVRVGPGVPELQWETIFRIKPNAIVTVPSFILKLIDYAEAHGIDYKSSPVKKAICIGEPLRNTDLSPNILAQKINSRWNIQLYSTYAATEMAAAFTECHQRKGGHLHPELLIAEIINDAGQTADNGETGELVITTLGVEGMPLLRFRTGDICSMHFEKCSCGRNTPRLGPVIGRKSQMIKYKGTTLYPGMFENILHDFDTIEAYFFEVFLNDSGTDEIRLHLVCHCPEQEINDSLISRFKSKLRVVPQIVFHTTADIMKTIMPDKARKPVRFVDRRI